MNDDQKEKVFTGLDKDEVERLMSLPATAVNRAALSMRSDLGMARLSFSEENVPGAPVHPRVAVTMPISVLIGLYHLIGGTLQQMEAAQAAHESGMMLSTAKN